MKVLITGASGLLGRKLFEVISKTEETTGTYFGNRIEGLYYLDVSDKNSVNNFFEKLKPDMIIHCAVLVNVDYCEEHPDEAKKVNTEGNEEDAFNRIRIRVKTDMKLEQMELDRLKKEGEIVDKFTGKGVKREKASESMLATLTREQEQSFNKYLSAIEKLPRLSTELFDALKEGISWDEMQEMITGLREQFANLTKDIEAGKGAAGEWAKYVKGVAVAGVKASKVEVVFRGVEELSKRIQESVYKGEDLDKLSLEELRGIKKELEELRKDMPEGFEMPSPVGE